MNKNNCSKKQYVKVNIQSIREKKISHRNSSQNQSVKNSKSNINNINNMKQNLDKPTFYSKGGEDYIENSKADKEDNGKINLSLRKFIFAKCGNNSSNMINKKY